MDEEHTDTRITGDMLERYLDKRVRLVVKVVEVRPQSAVVCTSDGHHIDVALAEDVKLTSKIVEINGIAKGPRFVRMTSVYQMGDDEDLLVIADATVRLMHKETFSSMFGREYGPQSK
ncbi:hypothetical protein SISSUDRAFT_1067286 [Sistotremastrum suecicum HHB10207 ss-3]|uniref:Replication factor A protein 3 n=1 Tax=Sistotremastrum suecicum HHB10207 ss-3 TaxID=1314776 RepID=A0A165XA52_9AGAM|nr:hypothetical protein SISSUDRAFT_1067286 [Sistotremastrum suecicum HHB10207 ss-3]